MSTRPVKFVQNPPEQRSNNLSIAALNLFHSSASFGLISLWPLFSEGWVPMVRGKSPFLLRHKQPGYTTGWTRQNIPMYGATVTLRVLVSGRRGCFHINSPIIIQGKGKEHEGKAKQKREKDNKFKTL